MGVIYKLKLQIKDFILEQKKADPNLSCRKLSTLILDKFQIKISKSSINAIIKDVGLSMPVGRRRKRGRQKFFLLKPEAQIKAIMPIETPAEEPSRVSPPAELIIEPAVEKTVEKPSGPILEVPPEKPKEMPVDRLVEEPSGPEAPAIERVQEISAETPCSGAILLKAADYLLGGSHYLTEAIKNRLDLKMSNLLAKTEALLYGSLFNLSPTAELNSDCPLWPLINQRFSVEELNLYLKELQKVEALTSDILRISSSIFQEVRCVKVSLSEGTDFYLDGQKHTVWSIPQIPYAFSTTLYNIKSYINKYFRENTPFLLFTAAGYDAPTKELFDFILGLETTGKTLSRLTLCGNKLEELEVIPLERAQPRFFMFGLWPWQFAGYRQLKMNSGFSPFSWEPFQKELYLAEGEVILSQPIVNQDVTLRACALKSGPNEKIRLIILSNLSLQIKGNDLASLYLSHWPNLEEAFQDFSRKIELFTYTATSQRIFSTENLGLSPKAPLDLKTWFSTYLKALDLYVKLHLLPAGYEDKDFPTINERFYSLKVQLKRQRDYLLAAFQVPSGYKFLPDLEYALRRINEREIVFSDGKRLWFTT